MGVFRRVIAFILVFACCFGMMGGVLATDGSESFRDVALDSPYYDSVAYLYDRGILQGTENRIFSPYEDLSLAQLMIFCERAFGDPAQVPAWSYFVHETDKGYRPDWFPWSEVEVPFGADWTKQYVSLEYAARVLLCASDCLPLYPYLYGVDYNMKSGLYRLYLEGYPFDGGINAVMESSVRTPATRGEFVRMLAFVLTSGMMEESELDEAKLDCGMAEIHIRLKDGSSLRSQESVHQSLNLYLDKIPDGVLEAYRARGGVIYYFDNTVWAAEGLEERYAGLYSVGNKMIRVNKSSSVIHEMGHFLNYNAPYAHDKARALFASGHEMEDLLDVVCSRYGSTNPEEYAAEAFRAYIYWPGELQERCPETYQMIADSVAYFDSEYAAEAA